MYQYLLDQQCDVQGMHVVFTFKKFRFYRLCQFSIFESFRFDKAYVEPVYCCKFSLKKICLLNVQFDVIRSEIGSLLVFQNLDSLKVHKNENFFGSDFEFCTISLLVTVC